MSAFGAPVPPTLVLGGYDGDNYIGAKSLIISFVVNNHKDESKNKKAEAWEKAFIDYLTLLQKDDDFKKLNLSIAFSSERSIQDEINRSSEADILTILLSYVLMFTYIAIGLGQFKSIPRILVCF